MQREYPNINNWLHQIDKIINLDCLSLEQNLELKLLIADIGFSSCLDSDIAKECRDFIKETE